MKILLLSNQCLNKDGVGNPIMYRMERSMATLPDVGEVRFMPFTNRLGCFRDIRHVASCYDVVHIHFGGLYALLLRLALIGINKPMVITFHGTDTLSFSLDFAVQPIFVLYAFDTHFAREQDFLDIVTFTAKIKTALTLLYNFTDSYSLALSLEGSFLPLSYGSSFTKLSSEPEFIPSGAKGGASHWFLGFNIGFRFNLFR